MRSLLYRILPKKLQNKILNLQKQAKNFSILSIDYGQWRTIRDWDSKNSLDEPIPWYTYPGIEYLSHLELGGFRVFEFGSGNSTIWWGRHSLSVHSIESDPDWHKRVISRISQDGGSINCDLREDKDSYVNSLSEQYDIVIIDGKHRRECAEKFIQNCSKSVILIFDNSDRYPETIDLIRKSLGWMELDFHGFGPINMYTWTTSIFINPSETHRIVYKKNLRPISGLGIITEGID
jgi:hypothetical protein